MLSSMVKEHRVKQQAHREEQEARKKAAFKTSSDLTRALVDHLNVGVAQAYLNQKRLDLEANQLEQNAVAFQRATHQWLGLVSTFSTALKEVGHVQNWANTIHSDMSMIAGVIEESYKDQSS